MSLVFSTLADNLDAEQVYAQMEQGIEENPALSRIYGWPPEHPPMPEEMGYTAPEDDDLPF